MKDKPTTPTLHSQDPVSGDSLEFHFGYFRDEPTVALFIGNATKPVMIPRQAIEAALQGWDMVCPHCET